MEEMLYALMIRSANDVAVAIAEKVAGSTDAFIALMNKRAREIGMTSTTFRSVHGLPPAPGQKHDETTARDLMLLCRELLIKHPEALKYTSARVRPFRPEGGNTMVMMRTHNHLLARLEGCDGFKTGYTARAGFSIAVTAARNRKRVIAIVLGSTDTRTRDNKAAELVNQAFQMLAAGSVPGTTAKR
jgi:D-alanyl-D-alanine carboxypeptidase (penicillin-binding protein 5/6)